MDLKEFMTNLKSIFSVNSCVMRLHNFKKKTNLSLDNFFHDFEKRVVLQTLVNAFEPFVSMFVGLLQRHIQIAVRFFGGQILQLKTFRISDRVWRKMNRRHFTYDDVEFRVNVDELPIVIDDRQG